MVWYRLKTAGALVIATVILVGCGDKNTGNPTGPVGNKLNDYTASYKIAGNKLILETQTTNLAYNYCNDTVLIHKNDTLYSATDTSEFNLNGDTLRLLFEPETLSFSKAIIVQYVKMIRKGSGTGLVGVWTDQTYGYNVISGVLTRSEQKSWDPNTRYRSFGISFEYEFTPTQCSYYISGEFDNATAFIFLWNSTYYYGDTTSYPADSAKYDVTVKRLSSEKVTLTGNKTNEVVTVTWDILPGSIPLYNEKYAEVFTSSNTEHSTYTYYSDPISCPNDPEPSWYSSFCIANARTNIAAKRSIHPNRLTGSNHPLMEIFRKPLKQF